MSLTLDMVRIQERIEKRIGQVLRRSVTTGMHHWDAFEVDIPEGTVYLWDRDDGYEVGLEYSGNCHGFCLGNSYEAEMVFAELVSDPIDIMVRRRARYALEHFLKKDFFHYLARILMCQKDMMIYNDAYYITLGKSLGIQNVSQGLKRIKRNIEISQRLI